MIIKTKKICKKKNYKYSNKKIHFLGMADGPNEIDLVKDYHHVITTWDSSAAIWAGMNGISFDNSPSSTLLPSSGLYPWENPHLHYLQYFQSVYKLSRWNYVMKLE